MFPPVDLVHVFPAAAGVLGSGLVGITALTGYRQWRLCTERRKARENPKELTRRICRYCFWGDARLTEERTRIDRDDQVEVRCFTCRRCGLPQWTVTRTAVTECVR